MCRLLKKSACPFGQVQTNMYLPESPIFKDSLAGASKQALMSVPVDHTIRHLRFEARQVRQIRGNC